MNLDRAVTVSSLTVQEGSSLSDVRHSFLRRYHEAYTSRILADVELANFRMIIVFIANGIESVVALELNTVPGDIKTEDIEY